MAKPGDKAPTPAYASKKSFTAFANVIREGGHVPMRIDRTLMPKFSGSAVTETLATLRFLKLTDEKSEPTPLFEEYVMASDEARKPILDRILRDSYSFIFTAPNFDLTRATSQTVADLFRAAGLSGSTLSRAMMFFLAAAAEAGIKVSPNVKPPPLSKNPRPKKPTAAMAEEEEEDEDESGDAELLAQGYQAFEIPIPINRKVRITIPADWSAGDWDLFQLMLTPYVDGWKAQMAAKKPPKALKQGEDEEDLA